MVKDDKELEYEKNLEKKRKLNRIYRVICLITLIPSVFMLLVDIISFVVSVVTLGTYGVMSAKGLILTVINLAAAAVSIEAGESKDRRAILIVIGILFIRIAAVGVPFTLLSAASLIGILSWCFGFALSPKWEELKNQEGFPNFNIAYADEKRFAGNTGGKRIVEIDAQKTAPAQPSSGMEELTAPDNIDDIL